MGLRRELALVVLGAVLGSIIPNTSQSLMAFFTNIFTLQSIPVDYSLVIAGIGVMAGFGAIGYNIIVESRNRKKKMNTFVGEKLSGQRLEKTPDEKVDDLIQEMLNFVNKWRHCNKEK